MPEVYTENNQSAKFFNEIFIAHSDHELTRQAFSHFLNRKSVFSMSSKTWIKLKLDCVYTTLMPPTSEFLVHVYMLYSEINILSPITLEKLIALQIPAFTIIFIIKFMLCLLFYKS